MNNLKPFDILKSSWGYDQTNVDYYHVVRTAGSMVVLQPIEGKLVNGEEGFMCGHSVPVPGAFKGAQLRRKVCADGESVRLNSYSWAHKMKPKADGTFEKSYVSWYA